MRQLLRPKVLELALAAGAGSALACYPRVSAWAPPHAIWMFAALLFLCAVMLWTVVFAWHNLYSKRHVFVPRPEAKLMLMATAIGLVGAATFHWLLDPAYKALIPKDYPQDFAQWSAMTLFALGFSQLFTVFAPLAWLLRLTRNLPVSAVLTCLVGIGVLLLKIQSLNLAVSGGLMAMLIAVRAAGLICLVQLYLRGGLLPAWWCGLLLEARHLVDLNQP